MTTNELHSPYETNNPFEPNPLFGELFFVPPRNKNPQVSTLNSEFPQPRQVPASQVTNPTKCYNSKNIWYVIHLHEKKKNLPPPILLVSKHHTLYFQGLINS